MFEFDFGATTYKRLSEMAWLVRKMITSQSGLTFPINGKEAKITESSFGNTMVTPSVLKMALILKVEYDDGQLHEVQNVAIEYASKEYVQLVQRIPALKLKSEINILYEHLVKLENTPVEDDGQTEEIREQILTTLLGIYEFTKQLANQPVRVMTKRADHGGLMCEIEVLP